MSEPELKFEIDEYGRIGYRVTNDGVLLSKDEKEFIIDRITRMQAENARLREERDYYKALWEHATATDCELRRVRTAWKEDRKQNAKLRQMVARMWLMATKKKRCMFADRLKLRAEIDELGIEVDE